MENTTQDKYCNADYQRKVGEMVSNNVIYCVSYLISELAKDEKHMDDLLPVCVSDDWETSATDEGWHNNKKGDAIIKEGVEHNGLPASYSSWQECCEDNNIEPQVTEAYEHWIVSKWLANRLEARGEMVIHEFMGMTIWGRATTGQSIALDSVICDIYDNTKKYDEKRSA